MPWLEIVAALFSLAGIWLGTRRYVLSWPIILVASLLYLVVFYQARLYSDTLLQAVFLIFTLYGWSHWQRGVREEGIVRVEPLGWSAALTGLAAGAVGSFLLGFVMEHYTNAALPRIDSTLTSFSLVATWWQTRKHTANWLLWIAVDCVYTSVFLYKDLYWTSALYLLLVLLALLGLRDWQRAADSQRTQTGCRTADGVRPGARGYIANTAVEKSELGGDIVGLECELLDVVEDGEEGDLTGF
jgi:nicotinamide mononucleotide transporter